MMHWLRHKSTLATTLRVYLRSASVKGVRHKSTLATTLRVYLRSASVKGVRHTWSLGIRAQLMLWYTIVFTLLLLLFSFILYTTLQTSLASGVDTALQLRALQIAAGISNDGGKITIQDVTGELPELDTTAAHGVPNNTGLHRTQTDVNVGTLVRILDEKGRTYYISPAFHALTLPSVSVTQPLHGVPWQDTVLAHNGQAVRLFSMPLTDNGTNFGVLCAYLHQCRWYCYA